jgi:hypothetical protein
LLQIHSESFAEDGLMTANVRQLLNSFEQLPETDKREAAAEILRRSLQNDFPPLEDTALVECAEELFLSLDQREAPSEAT